jgi:class 3 adenylate cyclase/ligand-binding sensor domain-containing protein/predicted metal-dependent HD superfamily phosphohydrolase
MYKLVRSVYILLLLLASFSLVAQTSNLKFQRLTIKEGLSQSSANTIIQDNFGLIWIGTQEGLNMFDGYDISYFKHQIKQNKTLSNSYVLKLFEDKNNLLWVATRNGGLNYKKPLSNSFNRTTQDDFNSNVIFTDIIEDNDGFLWLSSEKSGIYRYNHELDSIVKYTTKDGLFSNKISNICLFENDLFVGYFEGGVSKINISQDIKIQTDYQYESNFNLTVNDFYNYKDSLLYLGTNNGLKVIENDTIKKVGKGLDDIIISSLFCESPQTIWFGTKGQGLYSFQTINNKEFITNYKNNPSDLSSITSNVIYEIIQDFSGSIWVTTQEGVSYFDPLKQNFNLVTNNLSGEQMLIDKNVWSIYEESNSKVWIGNRKGISIVDIDSSFAFNFPFSSENKILSTNNDVWDMFIDQSNQCWVGTNSGIYQFSVNKDYSKGTFKRFKPFLEDLNQPVYDLNINEDNELWAATKSGVYVFDLVNNQEFKFEHDSTTIFPDAPCRRVVFTANDTWLGFDGGGLCRLKKSINKFEAKSYDIKQYLPDETENSISSSAVLSICEDKENNLWLGTLGGGFNKLNPMTETFELYTESDGLSNNTTYGLVIDENGDIWVSTIFGISKFNPKTKQFRKFNEGNGLQSNEFNNNAFYQSKSGRIYFGGINGFNYFNPKDIKINKISPKPLITEIEWLNEGKFENYLGEKLPYMVDTILLTFFQNDLSFTFKGLHYSDPKSNQYKIQLKGLYQDPLILKHTNTINYSNLSAGEYVFKVWISNIDGIWSTPRQIVIIVSPPIWATWEFYVGLGITALLIIWLVYILRVKAIKRQQRRLAFLVERRTKTITKQKNQIEQQNRKIEKEKEKADQLLLNILPSETADELKNKGVARTRQYRKVTVMFTDIKDFSKVAETMDPAKLVKSLDNLFREFDKIIEKYQIEKIKTMGDAYMAVGGLPLRDKENPINCVLAALEIQQLMAKMKEDSIKKGEGFWEVRIGIHTGDVIAGVIGTKRIAYDIWGSTVNIAQRMETSGETWKVNISESTFEHISPYFKCINRGEIPTKNTGDVKMYYVEGIKPHLSLKSKGIIPNNKFREYVDLHLYSSINYKKAERHIMKVLKKGLPENLHYHGIHHTYDVVKAVERIAIMEGVLDDDIFVLKSAATYHDAGFVEQYDSNEPVGARLAEEILPKYGYTDEQIEVVKKLIYATIIPHKPSSKLEEIICDADLDYLGRDDFFEIADTLRMELRDHGKIKSDRLWDEIQVKFLTQHKYFTKSAKKMRDAKKAEHLEVIKQKLVDYNYKD